MRYLAMGFDYDGTIAQNGKVPSATIKALEKLKKSDSKLLLVSGRELESVQEAFPEYKIFDKMVVENGALLFDPQTIEERLLTEPASKALVEELKRLGVKPISVGRCIVATWELMRRTFSMQSKHSVWSCRSHLTKAPSWFCPPG